MRIFLKAKAWQIFLLITCPMIPPLMGLPNTNAQIFNLISLTGVFVWIYSIGASANELLQSDLKKDLTIYRAGFLVPFVYGIFAFDGLMSNTPSFDIESPPWWVIALHVASTAGIFYVLIFTAKQFSAFEKNEKVRFVGYLSVLVLIFIPYAGVWFLQPRINRAFQTQ